MSVFNRASTKATKFGSAEPLCRKRFVQDVTSHSDLRKVNHQYLPTQAQLQTMDQGQLSVNSQVCNQSFSLLELKRCS